MRFRPRFIASTFAAALALFILSPSSVQSQTQERETQTNREAAESMRQADQLVKEGKLAEAAKIYYNITVDYPDNAEAHLKLARIYAGNEEWENAVGAYRMAAENGEGAERLEAYAGLTGALFKLGRYQAAAEAAPQLIELDPSNTDAHIYLAMSLAKIGKLDEAVGAAQKAVELAPESATAHASLGLAQFGLGSLGEAKASFAKALELDASIAEAHAGMADIMLANKDYDGAIAAATKAIELDNQLTQAYSIRGIAHNAKGDVAAAYSDLSMAVTVNPNDFEAQLAFGQMHEAQGNPHLAISYYQTAAQLNPSSTEAVVSLARVMANQGDASGAIDYLKSSLQQNPDSAELHYHLGRALGTTGQVEAAVSALDAALAIDSNFAAAHYERGKFLLNKKQDVAGALPSLKKAVDLEPDNPDYLSEYGSGLLASQQVDAALAVLSKAASTPGYANPVGLYNLGRAQLAKSNFSGAVETLQRAVEAAPPNWGAPYLALAWAHFGSIKKGCPCPGDEALVAAVQENYRKAVQLGVNDPSLQTRVEALARGEKVN
ncbi:MAG TPA: tetratricopeptide repeat protein [Vicinamibacteria bacterium]|nr:tetratricopeptide repeat protein [Vicinamibacteria bacterium]